MQKELLGAPSEPDILTPVRREDLHREILMVPAPAAGSPNVAELREMLLRSKGRFALAVLLGLAVSQAVNMLQKPMYRADASLEVQGLNENYLNLRDVDPNAPLSPQTMDSYIQTQVEILQNPILLERVAGQLNLDQQSEFTAQPNWLDRAAGFARLSSAPPLPPKQYAVKEAIDKLRVQQVRQSRMIRVSFDSIDPKLAANFVNTLLVEYEKQSLEARWQTSTQTRELLDTQLADLKSRLETSEYALQLYARENGLLFTADKGSIVEDRLRQIQAELSRAQADRISKQATFDAATSRTSDALPAGMDTTALQAYQSKLTDLKREAADLSALYQPENYKVARVQAQIAELQAAIQIEQKEVRGRVSKDYEASVSRERQLGFEYAQQARALADQSTKAVRYNVLLREVESNRGLYDGMLQRVKDARIVSAIRASNVRAIGTAEPPAAPYRPNIPLNLAAGLFLGVSVGFGTTLMRRRSNMPVRAPGEMSMMLNLPELGAIPRVSKHSIAGHLTPLLGGAADHDQVELITYEQKLSHVSESFRNTLASIVLRGPASAVQVLMVTSGGAMEGKTTMASNLGIALAEIGRSVLLVDADMRRPRLQSVFNVSNTWGLSDLLRDPNAIQNLPDSALAKTTLVQRLSLLPSGPPSKEFQRLLHSEAATALFQRLRQIYDHIIIDAPPLLYFADARVLGRLADGVVLVVRANQTTRNTVSAAAERLHADGIPLIGAILNDWNPQVTGNAYGYQDLCKYSDHYDRAAN